MTKAPLTGLRRSLVLVALMIIGLALFVAWRFQTDIAQARVRVAHGSLNVATPCGPIEYQEAGSGVPLLAVHGSGGGFDPGMAFAAPLTRRGIRVIAMSRFGYLRTPMRVNASPAAQADAHVCLLDALGIRLAAVLGGSAGAPSAIEMAIRHPDRTRALILLVPLTYKPPNQAASAPAVPSWIESTMMSVIGSDFLFWSALHVARNPMIGTVLATPPELVPFASASEQARVNAMLDTILPVAARAQGLRSDTAIGKHLAPADLKSIRAPTLVISARDDRYGTFASARHTATQIAGARFIGFADGGHIWLGHDAEVMAAIMHLLKPTVANPARGFRGWARNPGYVSGRSGADGGAVISVRIAPAEDRGPPRAGTKHRALSCCRRSVGHRSIKRDQCEPAPSTLRPARPASDRRHGRIARRDRRGAGLPE